MSISSKLDPAGEYLLKVTRCGPSATPFGWQIICQRDSSEIVRSAQCFATLREALADSTRAAWPLALKEIAVEEAVSTAAHPVEAEDRGGYSPIADEDLAMAAPS